MATLKELLAELAQDPERLGQFVLDPEKAMTDAELDEDDKRAMRSGFTGVIYARMSGMSVDDAFQIPNRFEQPAARAAADPAPAQPPEPPQAFPQFPAQFVALQLVPQFQQLPPQFQQLPPQFQQLPPQFQQLPPQFQQLPPQFQQLPPQFQIVFQGPQGGVFRT